MATITLRSAIGRPLTNDEVDANFINLNTDKLETAALGSSVQPFDQDLSAIAGLTGTTGLLRKNAVNTWSLDTSAYLTANQQISISGDAIGSGNTSILLTLNTVSVSKGGTGRTSLTANSLLVGNGTGAVNYVAPGSSGNLLVSNGTSWISQSPKEPVFYGVFPIFGTSDSSSEVRLYEDTDNGSNYLSLKAPTAMASNVTLTFPSTAGVDRQLLSTDGAGNLSWVDRPTRAKSYFYSSF